MNGIGPISEPPVFAEVVDARGGYATLGAEMERLRIGVFAAAAHARLFDAYATKPNGVPVLADSGQTWYQYPPSGNQAMQVVSGKLSNLQASGVAAGYQQFDLGAPVTRIGADVVFGSYTTDTGVFAILVWKTLHNSAPIPDSNLHLSLSPTHWILGTWAATVFTQVKSGTFASALTADGATSHHLEVILRGTTATIFLPDGSIATVTDAAIGATPGQIACFETYAGEASTDSKASALAVWADASSLAGAKPPDSTSDLLLPSLAALMPFGGLSKTVAAYWQPAAQSDVAIPGSATAISTTYLRLNFVVGPSGGAIVDLAGHIGLGAAADVYWGIVVGETGYGATVLALSSSTTGVYIPCRARFIVPAGTWIAGTTQQIDWTHFTTVTNAGTLLKVEAPLGRVATMTVSPL